MNRRLLIKTLLGLATSIPLGIKAASSLNAKGTVLLQESPLAGFQYYKGAVLWQQLREGQILRLVREKLNSFDERAVAVYWHDQKLGYLPRDENATVSQLLDRGENLAAENMRLKNSSNPWERIKMKIFYIS